MCSPDQPAPSVTSLCTVQTTEMQAAAPTRLRACSSCLPHQHAHHVQRPRQQQRSAASCKAASGAVAPSALFVEVDSVLCDLAMQGHRQAFNRAFAALGMDCANWTPAIYHDLLGKGDGSGEGLVAAYFETVGWPTFLPTNEQPAFAAKVHQLKQQQLRTMLQQGSVPLRDGIAQVLIDAVAAGARLGLIADTCSQPEDGVVACLLGQLPAEVAAVTTVYSTAPSSSSAADSGDDDAQLPAADGGEQAFDASAMAAAAARLKQQGAAEFVSRMATALEGKRAGVALQLDAALQRPAGGGASAAWLAAVAATLCDSPRAAVLLASSADLVAAGASAGMLAVAVPRAMAAAASYPAAAAKFQALGPGYATWQKLCSLYNARQQ